MPPWSTTTGATGTECFGALINESDSGAHAESARRR
jgi:hypothetical protein